MFHLRIIYREIIAVCTEIHGNQNVLAPLWYSSFLFYWHPLTWSKCAKTKIEMYFGKKLRNTAPGAMNLSQWGETPSEIKLEILSNVACAQS